MIDVKFTYSFSAEKNQQLVKERGVSFEAVIAALDNGKLLDIIENTEKYPHQKIYVIEMNGYAYLVTCCKKRKTGSIFKNHFSKSQINQDISRKNRGLI